MPKYTNTYRCARIKVLTPEELAAIVLKYKIVTHRVEPELLVNEGMPWCVLDQQDYPRLWYAFFATEEDAIRQWIACHDKELTNFNQEQRTMDKLPSTDDLYTAIDWLEAATCADGSSMALQRTANLLKMFVKEGHKLSNESLARKDVSTAEFGVQLQHRHFAFIAKTLAELECDEMPEEGMTRGQHKEICEYFARALAKTNPRFDVARFFKACGI